MDTPLINLHNLIEAIIYSALGLMIYAVGFVLLDRLAPSKHIWREINEEKNVAIAVLIGAVAIGIALIISAAIHG
ncbi:MAG TPA: DUF350 domain-containing protein, partial [Acidisphaera sp.]|nr:DUF350 domain-containing protein [Acidisphaera sp.]